MNTHSRDHHIEKCRAMFEKLSEYIDNELDAASCHEIEKHAKECIQCHVCLETLKRTIDLCKQTGEKPVPEVFSLKLKALIRELR